MSLASVYVANMNGQNYGQNYADFPPNEQIAVFSIKCLL